VDALFEPPNRGRVPQGVDTDVLDTGRLRRYLDDPQQVARVDGPAELVGENQSAVLPLISCPQLLGGLDRFVLA
jgi:hypothetical protein